MANLPGIPSNLHDGWFDGIWLSGDKDYNRACLFFRTVDGERFTLVLTGVATLNIRDIRQGNSIFEVLLITPDALTIEQVNEAYDLQSERDGDMSRRMFEKAQQQRVCALDMSTSYGASGVVLFRTIKVVPGHVLE